MQESRETQSVGLHHSQILLILQQSEPNPPPKHCPNLVGLKAKFNFHLPLEMVLMGRTNALSCWTSFSLTASSSDVGNIPLSLEPKHQDGWEHFLIQTIFL